MAKREDVLQKVLEAKQASGLGWKELAAKISSGSAIVTTAALLGQMTLTQEEARVAAELFSLTTSEATLLCEPPYRGAGPMAAQGPPTDPVLYRFHELLQVYGTTWKALIHEEFGDGIMSAIDFHMTLEREPDAKGDRVKMTMSGKFLPYKRY